MLSNSNETSYFNPQVTEPIPPSYFIETCYRWAQFPYSLCFRTVWLRSNSMLQSALVLCKGKSLEHERRWMNKNLYNVFLFHVWHTQHFFVKYLCSHHLESNLHLTPRSFSIDFNGTLFSLPVLPTLCIQMKISNHLWDCMLNYEKLNQMRCWFVIYIYLQFWWLLNVSFQNLSAVVTARRSFGIETDICMHSYGYWCFMKHKQHHEA